ELECVGQVVFANVWQTDNIVRIDATSGDVLTLVDASGLLTASEARESDVLNGIAYDAGADRYFLTGKLWPKLFEVRFDFDDAGIGGEGGGGAAGAPAEGGGGGDVGQGPSAGPHEGGTGAEPGASDMGGRGAGGAQ